MTDFAVRDAAAADQPVLERLWQLFRHDLSAYTGQLPLPDGTYRAERLHAAFAGAGWSAHLFTLDERPAGFAVLRGLDGPGPRVLSAFFLIHPARRRGHGLAAAVGLLRRHPGAWEIPFQDANTPAAAFWPRVADAAAGPGAWDLEHRPVPGKPHVPHDAWLRLTVAPAKL